MSSIASFTGSVPTNYDRFLGPFLFDPYAVDLANRAHPLQPKSILELACGTGRLTKQLVSSTAFEQLTATDLNADMLEFAKAAIKHPNISWEVADAQELPFSSNSFDLVACQFGVMFFPDKQRAFIEAHRVLNEGGVFVFNTWGSVQQNPGTALLQEILTKEFTDNPPDFFTKGPFSFHDEAVIAQLLASAGFKNIKIDPVEKIGFSPSAADAISGFVDGSPLGSYVDEQKVKSRDEIKSSLTEAFGKAYGFHNVEVPMLALVCEATK